MFPFVATTRQFLAAGMLVVVAIAAAYSPAILRLRDSSSAFR
jgi:hypothetical protein